MKKLLITLASVITIVLNAQTASDIYGASNGTATTNYNRQHLKEWDAAISKLITTGTTQATVLLIANSWATQDKIHQPIATTLRDNFGDAGVGYCGTNSLTTSSGFNQVDNFAATRTVTGSWGNISQKAWVMSGNISADSSSTLNDSITFTSWCTNPVIHYMQKTGGGDFVYRIDGTSPTTVSTSGTNSLIILPTATVTDGSHRISIKISATGTTGVNICGVELNRNRSGIRVHNLGVAGSKTSEWLLCDSVTFKNAVSSFSPNMVMISLGVNDCRSNVKPEIVIGNLKRIVNRVVAAYPNTSICIFTESDIGDNTTYPMSYYIDQMRTYALNNNYSFIDNYTLLGAFVTASVTGVYQDAQHVNAVGGNIFKNNFLDYLVPFDLVSGDGFTLPFYHSVTGPFNNITYYFGQSFGGIATSSGVTGKTYLQWDCTLVGYSMFTYVAGTLGTSENQSYYVRVNNSTDIPLTTTDKVNALSNYSRNRFLNANLKADDYIEIKGVCPSMGTPPVSVSRHVILYFKRR